MGESEAPSLLQKEVRRSAKSDVSKVLFPDIGKITNRQRVRNIFAEFLSKNSCLETGFFPEELKFAEAFPIYKKNDKKDNRNYRPISLLSNISKVYERCMQEQLDKYFSDLLLKYQCGFRQGYETQNCFWL